MYARLPLALDGLSRGFGGVTTPDKITSATLGAWWDWTTASYQRQNVSALSVDAWTNPNGGTISITFTTPHGLATGDYVHVVGDGGTQAANGGWQVTVANSLTLSLNGSIGNGGNFGRTQTVYAFKTPVVSDGQGVGVTICRAGSFGWNPYEPNGGQQPLWKAGVLNGQGAIQLTAASNQRLSVTQLSTMGSRNMIYATSNLTWFVCGAFIGTPSGRIFSQKAAGDTADFSSINGGGINYNAPGLQIFSLGRSTNLLLHDNAYTGGAFYVVARMANGTGKINVNGTVVTAPYGNATTNIAPDTFRIGMNAQNSNTDQINAYLTHGGTFISNVNDTDFDKLVGFCKAAVGL